MNDSQVHDRVVAKRDAIARKIADLQASLAYQKSLLAEMDALLDGIESETATAETTPTETPAVERRRRGRPKSTVHPTKQPRLRAPFRRLSVAKAVRKVIEDIDGEFGIGDLVDAIYETDADTDTKRVKFAVTNEISDLYRRSAGITRVRRGVYRRSDGATEESAEDTSSEDTDSDEESN